MEDFSEFLGWLNVALFSLVVVLGLLLRFGKLKASRKAVSLAHLTCTGLAVASVLAHFWVVEARPWVLIALGIVVLTLPVVTFILKRMKKLKWAVNFKLAAVPVLALGLWVGHLTVVEAESGEAKFFSHQEDKDWD